MVIATRIRNGDNVPNKDTRFLLENEPEMYLRAILFRQKNNNPKKYKSILEDEKNDSVEESSSGISSVYKGVEVSISVNNIEVSVDVE